jgi:3-oxoacyl-[acyl-carrier-protein] synthase-3
MNIRIKGTGSAIPKLRVTNDDLGRIVDTSDEWIKSRTGIEARHLAVDETTTSLSAEAARIAIADAGLSPCDIDLIIAATVTPDKFFPNLSCEVQSRLGAKNAVAFDISAACSGFLFSMAIAKLYIECGMCRNALLIGAETLSKIIDWSDRSTCVLFGDGAGAAVIGCDEENTATGRGILSIVQGSDGARGEVLSCANRPVMSPYAGGIKNDESVTRDTARVVDGRTAGTAPDYISMNGQEVYKFAVRTVPAAINEALSKASVAADDVDMFLLHQANIRIIEAVAKRLGQPVEKFPTNLNEYGNISAASVPILLDNMKKCGKIKNGSKIVLAGFGAGLTWSAAVLEW